MVLLTLAAKGIIGKFSQLTPMNLISGTNNCGSWTNKRLEVYYIFYELSFLTFSTACMFMYVCTAQSIILLLGLYTNNQWSIDGLALRLVEHSQVLVHVFQYSRDRSATLPRVWTAATAMNRMVATPASANMAIGGCTAKKVQIYQRYPRKGNI